MPKLLDLDHFVSTKYGHRSFLSFLSFLIFKTFIFYVILNIFLEYGLISHFLSNKNVLNKNLLFFMETGQSFLISPKMFFWHIDHLAPPRLISFIWLCMAYYIYGRISYIFEGEIKRPIFIQKNGCTEYLIF